MTGEVPEGGARGVLPSACLPAWSRHAKWIARLLAFLAAMAAIVFLGSCGNAHEPNANQFRPGFAIGGVPGLLHLDQRLTNQERAYATSATRKHFDAWNQQFGPWPHARLLDVVVHKVSYLEGPQRTAVAAYVVEAPPPATRDEIHVIYGHKGTLGRLGPPRHQGLLAEYHQVSKYPRDYYYQNPSYQWDLVLGFSSPAQNTAGLAAGPAPAVNIQQGQVTWTVGALERVMLDLEARR